MPYVLHALKQSVFFVVYTHVALLDIWFMHKISTTVMIWMAVILVYVETSAKSQTNILPAVKPHSEKLH